jgi:hypothetical protein
MGRSTQWAEAHNGLKHTMDGTSGANKTQMQSTQWTEEWQAPVLQYDLYRYGGLRPWHDNIHFHRSLVLTAPHSLPSRIKRKEKLRRQ